MKSAGIQSQWNLKAFFFFFLVFAVLEFYGQVVERGLGYYLKWQNDKRQQLGRLWENDRENIIAQRQVQSLLSSLDSREKSSESLKSFKDLFQSLQGTQILSREKFIKLYYDYPGQWVERIISPMNLLNIDSNINWNRVLFSKSGNWITVSFIDPENNPLHQEFLSSGILYEVQSTRTVKQGKLEDVGFQVGSIYPMNEFIPLLQTLDPFTRETLFPDPQWFLQRDYHVTRIGVAPKAPSGNPQTSMFGIEYLTDFYSNVLVIPVPTETLNNLLSQIDQSDNELPEFSF